MAEGIRAHSRLTTLHLADGGFVDNLKQKFGFGGPPESMTERYARQDRECAAKSAAKAPAPAPEAKSADAVFVLSVKTIVGLPIAFYQGS